MVNNGGLWSDPWLPLRLHFLPSAPLAHPTPGTQVALQFFNHCAHSFFKAVAFAFPSSWTQEGSLPLFTFLLVLNCHHIRGTFLKILSKENFPSLSLILIHFLSIWHRWTYFFLFIVVSPNNSVGSNRTMIHFVHWYISGFRIMPGVKIYLLFLYYVYIYVLFL